jgi:hypothetical protein
VIPHFDPDLLRESAPRAPSSRASRWCVNSARSGQFQSESVDVSKNARPHQPALSCSQWG